MRRAIAIVPLVLALASVSASVSVSAQADTSQTRALTWTVDVASGPVPFNGVPSTSGSFTSVSLRWERTMLRLGSLDLRFAPELIPYAALRDGLKLGDVAAATCPVVQLCVDQGILARTNAVGIGAAPIAMRADWAITSRFGLTAGTRVAALFTDEYAPFGNQRGPSFLLDGSIGVRVGFTDVTSLEVTWVRTSLANGTFVLDERAMKTSGVRVGLTRAQRGGFPRIAADSAGSVTQGWVLSAGAGSFSPLGGFDVNAQLSTVTWLWERVIAGDGALALSAGAELMPLVLARADKLVLPSRARCTSGPCPVIDSYGNPTIGVGVAPLAVRFHGRVVPRLQLWGDASAGGVAFDRAYPVRDSNRLNFLLGVGAGITVQLSATRALAVGYRLQHLSNGFTADRNPGVNFHALTLALQRVR